MLLLIQLIRCRLFFRKGRHKPQERAGYSLVPPRACIADGLLTTCTVVPARLVPGRHRRASPPRCSSLLCSARQSTPRDRLNRPTKNATGIIAPGIEAAQIFVVSPMRSLRVRVTPCAERVINAPTQTWQACLQHASINRRLIDGISSQHPHIQAGT